VRSAVVMLKMIREVQGCHVTCACFVISNISNHNFVVSYGLNH